MSHERHVGVDETATLPHLPAERAITEFWIDTFFGMSAPGSVRVDRPLTIGRDPSCAIVIEDGAASSKHAELHPIPEGLLVRDRQSRNGTFLDGTPIDLAEVTADATLRIGETLFRLTRRCEPWIAPSAGPLVAGSSFALVRRKIALVGPTKLPVLVLGETGTGKDVVARLVHEASGRSGAFIAVNCAALPETVVEAELFGHARSAFAGAAEARKGLFGAANGGTLFLDEVADLPLSVQGKLLRVIEDGEVRPLGSEAVHKLDVRVISATNRDLHARVSLGEFRADLLARLSVVDIALAPLRERRQDIPALSSYLLGRADHSNVSLACDALEAMVLYDWPMNVRELDTVLRNTALSGPSRIDFLDLPLHVRSLLTDARGVRHQMQESVSRSEIERALRLHGGNVRKASHAAKISRAHFYRLLKRWELDPDSYRTGTAG